jgi:HEAT repeat protein
MDDSGIAERLQTTSAHPEASVRLRVAMAAGTHPDPQQIEVLMARCAVEPDFTVREMLTWALIRHDPEVTVGRLIRELRSEVSQARSQALHTLSKIGDPRAWPAITRDLLVGPDETVARAAWRTAAGLAPPDERPALAELLAIQFGRGGRDVQLSLCRALAMLGDVALPVVQRARVDPRPEIRAHAIATERLIRDPEEPPFAFLDVPGR